MHEGWEPGGGTSRSGVHEKGREPLAAHILLVEPDEAVRAQLLEEARAVGIDLVVVSTPEEAAAVRETQRPAFVACSYPMPGAVRLVDELHGERFPVAVVTNEVPRAIATFGLDVPILPKPITLVALVEQAAELSPRAAPLAKVALSGAPSPYRSPAEPAPPRDRDPGRE